LCVHFGKLNGLMSISFGCGSSPITLKIKNINKILILWIEAKGLFSKDMRDAGS